MTARTNLGMALFEVDAEHRFFLGLMHNTVLDFGWKCLSYCLMPNHVHLLIRHVTPNLSPGMQRLATRYARYYNDRRERYGHVFQGRFGSRIVARESHLREVMRYIALNPVRAGLCPDPAGYPWSAHRALLGVARTGFLSVDEGLGVFGTTGTEARAAYGAFVADRSADQQFATGYGSPLGPDRGVAAGDLSKLVERLDRDALITTAHLEHGYSLAAIARALGCARSTVTRRFAKLEREHATRGV